jgi:hypothetical protein
LQLSEEGSDSHCFVAQLGVANLAALKQDGDAGVAIWGK